MIPDEDLGVFELKMSEIFVYHIIIWWNCSLTIVRYW